MPRFLKYIGLALICLLPFVATGCAKVSTMYNGNLVSSVPVVSLQDRNADAGQWETFDMIIDYEYTHKNDIFEINGQVVLGQHYQMTYDRLWRLDVYLFFVDENSRVLETYNFLRTAGRVPDERMSVAQSYRIPAGTTGLSFGYSGIVGERRSKTNFYQLPLNK